MTVNEKTNIMKTRKEVSDLLLLSEVPYMQWVRGLSPIPLTIEAKGSLGKMKKRYFYLLLPLTILLLTELGCDQWSNPDKNDTGLKLSSEYSKTYPAYEQDLGGGLKLYSKVPIPPPIKVWNYEIKTTSRIYYAVKVKETSEGVSMTGFWATEGDKWKFNNDEIFMSYKAYGKIEVSKAPAYEIR